MKKLKNTKMVLMWTLLVVFVVTFIFLYYIGETSLALLIVLFAIFDLIILLQNIFNNNPSNQYNMNLNHILKTYECILVEIANLPDLTEKKIIPTKTFQDIVNTEYETKKPVYYLKSGNAYDFLLINKDEVYVYTIKKEEEKKSKLDEYLYVRNIQEQQLKIEQDTISNLDQTTTIIVDENEAYKVSPIR